MPDPTDAELAERLAIENESLRAEHAHLAKVAGEALGTDPELQTATGCVEALAGWAGSLRGKVEGLTDRNENLARAVTTYLSELKALRKKVEKKP